MQFSLWRFKNFTLLNLCHTEPSVVQFFTFSNISNTNYLQLNEANLWKPPFSSTYQKSLEKSRFYFINMHRWSSRECLIAMFFTRRYITYSIRSDYFYSYLILMLVHHRVSPSITFVGTHVCTWVERHTINQTRIFKSHVETTQSYFILFLF